LISGRRKTKEVKIHSYVSESDPGIGWNNRLPRVSGSAGKGQSMGQPVGQSMGQSIDQSMGQSMGQPMGQPISQSMG